MKRFFSRSDSAFTSGGERCAGWLYVPEGVPSPPVVVMAHGFAAERTFGLPAFAERFAEAGLAVFVFDYRYFGDSDGYPRNLVSPARQLQDWRAAIAHVRQLPDVDGRRVALWGTSYSGGHVMVAAARDPEIDAIVCQTPFVDPISSMRMLGRKYVLGAAVAILRDAMRVITFRKPYYVPVVNGPTGVACLASADSTSGYLSLVPASSSWANVCPARSLLLLVGYRPRSVARRVTCPALVVVAEKDSLIDGRAVRKAARRMASSKLISMPVGHFALYVGEPFETVVTAQIEFLAKHLGVDATDDEVLQSESEEPACATPHLA